MSFGPRTGKVCAGGYTYYTFGLPLEQYNYYANTFKDTLKMNKSYCFKMYLKLNKQFKHGSNNLGVFFENTTMSYSTTSFLAPASPIATLSMTVVDTTYKPFSFSFIANGNETDFMIGGYMPYASANYPLVFPSSSSDGSFFIYDDFSLVPTDIDLGNDITICSGSDSLLIGEPNWAETNYKWYADGILIDTLNGQIRVKPGTTTTYILQKTTSCTTTQDTLVVTFSGSCPDTSTAIKELIIPNVFSPNNDSVNDVFRFEVNGVKNDVSFAIHNRWGNLVKEITPNSLAPNISSQVIILWDGRTTSGETCNEGVYFYTLKFTDVNGEQQSRNGYVSLFR